MKSKDLAQLGIIEDPDNPGHGILLKDMEKPNEQMDSDTLAALAKRYEAKADHFSRQESLQRYLQGWALTIAHDRMGRGPHTGWGAFLKEHGFSRPTAYRAEELYLRSSKQWGDNAEAEVAQRSLMELYKLLEIVHDKPEAEPTKPPETKGGPLTPQPGDGTTDNEQEDEEEKEPEEEEENEQEQAEAEEIEQDVAIRVALKKLSAGARATVILNILGDLYDDLPGPCDNDMLNTLDLINDVIEAIKAKGYEDDEELQQYQPESMPDVSLAG